MVAIDNNSIFKKKKSLAIRGGQIQVRFDFYKNRTEPKI